MHHTYVYYCVYVYVYVYGSLYTVLKTQQWPVCHVQQVSNTVIFCVRWLLEHVPLLFIPVQATSSSLRVQLSATNVLLEKSVKEALLCPWIAQHTTTVLKAVDSIHHSALLVHTPQMKYLASGGPPNVFLVLLASTAETV